MECVKCKKEKEVLQEDNLIYRWIKLNIAFRTKKSWLTTMSYCNNCQLAVLSNNYCKLFLQLTNTNNIKKSFNDDFCVFTIAYGRDLDEEIFVVRCFDTNKKPYEVSYDLYYVDNLSDDEVYRQAMKYIDNLIFI